MDCFSDYVYAQLLGNSVIWIVLVIMSIHSCWVIVLYGLF